MTEQEQRDWLAGKADLLHRLARQFTRNLKAPAIGRELDDLADWIEARIGVAKECQS